MDSLTITSANRRYRALIGTGGIRAGTFFALNGNHTLGREESRSGQFLDRKDYCKLHIIAHYVQTLMGPDFTTLPIGKVGDDRQGQTLLGEMAEAGLDIRYVHSVSGRPTLYSFCFVYPDGSGGNLTVDDSACSEVDPAFVRLAAPDIAAFSNFGVTLAVPEVPLAARSELIELGTQHRCLRTASFTSEEIKLAQDSGILAKLDLLAINIDEAAALTGVSAQKPVASLVDAAIGSLQQCNASMQILITAGAQGSWASDGEKLVHAPIHKVEVVSTAGAGDAFFAGLLVGLAAGLPLFETQQLGTLVAALSVTSPHTINKDINRKSLKMLAERLRLKLPVNVHNLLDQQVIA